MYLLLVLIWCISRLDGQAIHFPGDDRFSNPAGFVPSTGFRPVKFPDDFIQPFGGSVQLKQRRPQTPTPRPNPNTIIFPVQTKPEEKIPCQTRNGGRGLCLPSVKCLAVARDNIRVSTCRLSNDPNQNKPGVCCPLRIAQDVPRSGVATIPKEQKPDIVFPDTIRQQDVDNSIQMGFQKLQEKEQKEDRLIEMNLVVFPDNPAFKHQKFFESTPEAIDKGKDAEVNIQASLTLQETLVLTPEQSTFGLPSVGLQNTPLERSCERNIPCDSTTAYRTIDGSCNNLRKPSWGQTNTPFQRILQPQYGEGLNSPREIGISRNDRPGGHLPSGRVISNVLANDLDMPYTHITLMVMQWGQFLDHDIVHTPIEKGKNKANIACCRNGQHLPSQLRHPACFPIDIPPDDPFYRTFGQRCMEFVRSLPAPREECNFGPREQMNQLSPFIDGSNVYGAEEQRNGHLRTTGGRLAVQNFGKGLLPEAIRADGECTDRGQPRKCFVAGDVRANEQVELTAMHTIWVREHNRIVEELSRLNNWNDDTLYEEARRIVIAQMQHITYNEFLPLFLGDEFVTTFGLRPRRQGFTRFYNLNINPQITNAFATAAYRFGHTLIQGFINTVSAFGKVTGNFPLSGLQFSPFLLYEPGFLDSFLRGLTEQPAQQFDTHFTDEVRGKLFQGPQGFGMDLVALNIQRGRDHGLPPYNRWREICKLGRVNSFQELSDRGIMKNETVMRLRRLYNDVEDLDLFVAGVAEIPLPGGLLGPTFICLVGDQFTRIRLGDRFFYEEGGQAGSFTEAQLNEIRKSSLSRIICDNSDSILSLQPLSFQSADSVRNPRLPCEGDSIPRMDLTAWAAATV